MRVLALRRLSEALSHSRTSYGTLSLVSYAYLLDGGVAKGSLV